MFARGAEFTVDRTLKVRLELIRFLDRHRYVAGEIPVGRTASSFCDMRWYRVGRASDLACKSTPLSCKKPSKCGGFERKHVGFLPYLKFSEIRHGRNVTATRCKTAIIPLRGKAPSPARVQLGA